MTAGKFETEYGPIITGTMSAEVLDPSGVHPPVTIIQTEDAFLVRCNWEVQGLGVPLMDGNCEFKLQLYAESLGSDAEFALGSITRKISDVPLNPGPPPSKQYSNVDINVPAGTLSEGPWRLTTLLTFTDAAGIPRAIAGFVEGPVIQLYKHV